MTRLEVGDTAPDFTLQADDGTTVTLSALRGQPVALYFYPKDATPGCTIQACEFRDAKADLDAAGAIVYGISPDPIASHESFRAQEDLNFPLLSDPEHTVAEAYGAWGERSMYGRTFMGIIRSSFLIAADGTIAQALYNVKAKGNAAKVLAALAD